jgi:Rod binding domain-containing protein
MSDPVIGSAVSTRGKDDLARLADSKSPEALMAAGKKLEGVFLSMMIEQMRSTMTEDGLFGSGDGADIYGGLFDRMMGEKIAERAPLGIAQMIVRSQKLRAPIADANAAAKVAAQKENAAGNVGGQVVADTIAQAISVAPPMRPIKFENAVTAKPVP